MRLCVVACIGLLAAGVGGRTAAAADLPRQQPIQATFFGVPPDIWVGPYLGIVGGGGWGQSQWDGVDRFDISGGLIGGTIGYNFRRFGQVVVGVEGDVAWSGIGGTTIACAPACETRNHWLATARGRVGYAFDNLLPYVTAGLAVGDIEASVPGFPAGSVTSAGFTAGFGLEVGLSSTVRVKAEYLYVGLGDYNCGFNCGLGANGNVSFYANVLRGGLNIRFR